MTIDEAITDLSIQKEVKQRLGKEHQAKALWLGIEALELLKEKRAFFGDRPELTLPSETKD